jgi:hypothetical protein
VRLPFDGYGSLLESGELVYTLQPGDIPLKAVEPPAGAGGAGLANEENILLLSGEVSVLQNSSVTSNHQVRQSVSWTEFEVVAQGGCEEDVFVSHTVEAGEAGPLAQEHSNQARKRSSQTYTKEREFSARPFREITVEARNRVVTFTVRERPSGNVAEESSVNANPIQFRQILTECHDSGGG